MRVRMIPSSIARLMVAALVVVVISTMAIPVAMAVSAEIDHQQLLSQTTSLQEEPQSGSLPVPGTPSWKMLSGPLSTINQRLDSLGGDSRDRLLLLLVHQAWMDRDYHRLLDYAGELLTTSPNSARAEIALWLAWAAFNNAPEFDNWASDVLEPLVEQNLCSRELRHWMGRMLASVHRHKNNIDRHDELLDAVGMVREWKLFRPSWDDKLQNFSSGQVAGGDSGGDSGGKAPLVTKMSGAAPVLPDSIIIRSSDEWVSWPAWPAHALCGRAISSITVGHVGNQPDSAPISVRFRTYSGQPLAVSVGGQPILPPLDSLHDGGLHNGNYQISELMLRPGTYQIEVLAPAGAVGVSPSFWLSAEWDEDAGPVAKEEAKLVQAGAKPELEPLPQHQHVSRLNTRPEGEQAAVPLPKLLDWLMGKPYHAHRQHGETETATHGNNNTKWENALYLATIAGTYPFNNPTMARKEAARLKGMFPAGWAAPSYLIAAALNGDESGGRGSGGSGEALQSLANTKTNIRQAYQDALAEEPDHLLSLYGLATAVADDGKPDEALELLNRAISTSPHYHWAHYQKYRLLLKANRMADAEHSLHRARELSHNTTIMGEVMEFVAKTGTHEELRRLMNTTSPTTQFPVDLENVLQYARILLNGGKPEEGIRLMERWNDTFGDSTETYPAIAAFYLARNDQDRSEEAISQWIDRDPWNKEPYLWLAAICTMGGTGDGGQNGEGSRTWAGELRGAVNNKMVLPLQLALEADPAAWKQRIVLEQILGNAPAAPSHNSLELVAQYRKRVKEDGEFKAKMEEGSNATVLLESVEEHLWGRGYGWRLIHRIIGINTHSGAAALQEFRGGRSMKVLEMRTIKADGSIVEPDSDPDKGLAVFSQVSPGDAIEYRVLVPLFPNLPGGGYETAISAQPEGLPVYQVHVKLVVPVARDGESGFASVRHMVLQNSGNFHSQLNLNGLQEYGLGSISSNPKIEAISADRQAFIWQGSGLPAITWQSSNVQIKGPGRLGEPVLKIRYECL